MLGGFVDRIAGLLDRRFLVAFWLPAFLAGVAATNLTLALVGWTHAMAWWVALPAAGQAWWAIVALATVTLITYALQAAPVLRLYEGYALPGPLARWGRCRQASIRDRLRKRVFDNVAGGDSTATAARATAERALLAKFPRDPALVRPTRLGNVLTAAEEYAYARYRLDAVVWWPRLAPLLPALIRQQIDEALLPLLAFLNLSLLIATLTPLSAGLLLASGAWLAALAALVSGSLGVWGLYCAAVAHAPRYGTCVRVAFDLHRHNLLEALHVPLPSDLVTERLLWEALTQWVYRGQPPWDAAHPGPIQPAPTKPTEPAPADAPTMLPTYPSHYRQPDVPPASHHRSEPTQLS